MSKPVVPARGGRRADLNDQYFRSKMEANWARYLQFLVDNGEIESWEYEPDEFEFVGIKRGARFYKPDFKIVDSGKVYYHEVKGHMDSVSRTKLKRMKKYHPDVEIQVIGKTRYNSVAKTGAAIIPGWE